MKAFEQTVEAARGGDDAAFGSLFERSLPRLVAFVRARAGGAVAAHESAHDLALSVCREALEDIDRFDYRSEEAFRHWLFVRAARKINNRHRYLHRHKRDVSREVSAPARADGESEFENVLTAYATLTTPSRILSARDECTRIEEALAALPDAQREAITLTRVAGLSYAEAAEQSDKTESSMRGLVMRGLARLAELLEED
ncbi:MAG: sigma-70 family RNA polymerase sigma factor [Planctomycetes bacterium]|nr:sigma-70 family RNA polymerase sigma factor [Planctomycetota bacterium]